MSLSVGDVSLVFQADAHTDTEGLAERMFEGPQATESAKEKKARLQQEDEILFAVSG